MALAGAAVYVGASAATYLYLRGRSPDNPTAPCCQSSDVFDRNADIYDRQIDLDETLMGVKLLRRWLVGKAEGDVLEVAAGTGRNLKYYHSPAVKSLTLIDTSREMLLRAYDKHKEAVEKGGTRVPVRVALADVQNLCAQGAGALQGESATRPLDNEESTKYGPALRSTTSFPPQSLFDTVVDTFGLCSCSDPLQALKVRSLAVAVLYK